MLSLSLMNGPTNHQHHNTFRFVLCCLAVFLVLHVDLKG